MRAGFVHTDCCSSLWGVSVAAWVTLAGGTMMEPEAQNVSRRVGIRVSNNLSVIEWRRVYRTLNQHVNEIRDPIHVNEPKHVK